MENLQDVIRLGSRLKVLYVEDDVALRNETRNLFEKIFKSVDVAGNGAEGLMRFSQQQYDLVITDIEMPELNGLEMSKKIKELHPNIPIVVISAYSNSSYLIEAIGIGINYYILKPILLPQLLSTLSKVVTQVEDRRMVLECQQRELQASIRLANEKLFHAMTSASPNPVIICDGRNVSFYNEAFGVLFEPQELQALKEEDGHLMLFLEQKIEVDQLFADEHEFAKDLDFMDLKDGEPVKLSLKTRQGTRIYLLLKNMLSIDAETTLAMFTFNDITVLSFQNIQLKEYDKVMGKMMEEEFIMQTHKEADIINKTTFEDKKYD